MIQISYKTKTGGHVLKKFADSADAEKEILRLFRRRTSADAYIDHHGNRFHVGIVEKREGRWMWMFDNGCLD